MKVKICGIKSVEAAMAAVDGGADLIGFVFAESRRRISPTHAKQIADEIPNYVKKVGVFVNETYENIIEISNIVGLDYIQLHGDESPEFAKSLSRPVIKAWSILQKIEPNFPCDYHLIDSPPGGRYRGGTGDTFDWTLIDSLPINKNELILAGGLNEKNVKEAIYRVQPAVIDVSSGVETNEEKDPEKMKAFVKAAKQAFQILKGSEEE
ncbi:phosphoribosylanthranilate isomerase [Heyndrickxia sp. NPDC080065]|uniref:phosphoribosylanthranilate isomerase n=1 Tax=Heyndrickxia sp. NPDC080065 TaxID=3390568 RepID=UPI003CFC5D98